MAEAASSGMTVDAFLACAVERPGRYELENGQVVASICHAVADTR